VQFWRFARDSAARAFDLLQDLARVGQKSAACRRQRDPGVAAVEQADPEFVLQLADRQSPKVVVQLGPPQRNKAHPLAGFSLVQYVCTPASEGHDGPNCNGAEQGRMVRLRGPEEVASAWHGRANGCQNAAAAHSHHVIG
jgi:hypothetical protein